MSAESEAQFVIAQAMDAAGITRSGFAALLGIHRSRITNVLNGNEANLTVRTLDEYLADAGLHRHNETGRFVSGVVLQESQETQ